MHKNPIGNSNTNKHHYAWDVKRETPSWVYPALAGFWFVGLFMVIGAYAVTAITIFETLKWFLLFATIGTLVPFKHIIKGIWMDYTFWITANVVGFGPLLTGLFLIINLIFSSAPQDVTHAITDIPGRSTPLYSNVTVQLENSALEDYDKFRTFIYREVRFQKSVTFTFESGLFGYDVLIDTQLNASL